jgi:hypothetical protein
MFPGRQTKISKFPQPPMATPGQGPGTELEIQNPTDENNEEVSGGVSTLTAPWPILFSKNPADGVAIAEGMTAPTT